MNVNYLTTVNTVRAVIQSAQTSTSSSSLDEVPKISGIAPSKAAHLPSRVVIIGSVLSMLGMIGYSAYVSSKFALRGLADSLRSELKPLGIKVQMYFPGNMDTPGYEEENKGKPAITKEIEGTAGLATAAQASKDMAGALLSERYYCTNDLLGELIRVSVHGGAPRPNLMFEVLASPLLAIVFSVWAVATDMDISAHFKAKKGSK
ncbi:3-dehydrosphinganine reductase [Kappamyces sp. JEL0680]|nr:3-dehydrosphinganine reductase [Kappamyces sp. JEL0680]